MANFENKTVQTVWEQGEQRVTDIIATAPGRCGLIGNPTDMYGGCVISCTTQERAECRLKPETDALMLTNEDEQQILQTREDLQFRGDKLDIARAALTFFNVDPACDHFALHLKTDIPMRAGLAGSTAMLAAIVGALDAYLEWNLNRYALAETTRKIEARVMGIVCGLQDQHMAVFGGLNFMDYAGKQELEQQDDEPLATIEPLSLWMGEALDTPPLLLAHTGIQHHSGTVHKSPRERWLSGERVVRDSYAQIAHLARQGKRALVEQRWRDLGMLMNENHAIVAALGGSGPANETLIAAARKAGAYGAKLAGAGGGGTILTLTHDPEIVGAALMSAGAERLLIPKPQSGLILSRR